jgi:uncharacterized BrkB/YihY/UPF0761 family membrane protein
MNLYIPPPRIMNMYRRSSCGRSWMLVLVLVVVLLVLLVLLLLVLLVVVVVSASQLKSVILFERYSHSISLAWLKELYLAKAEKEPLFACCTVEYFNL